MPSSFIDHGRQVLELARLADPADHELHLDLRRVERTERHGRLDLALGPEVGDGVVGLELVDVDLVPRTGQPTPVARRASRAPAKPSSVSSTDRSAAGRYSPST